MAGSVSLVLVSHSELIANGTKELAAQMAQGVHIGAAGGDPQGGLGSSFDRIEDVVDQALEVSDGQGVAILTDLGSTTMMVDSVIEFSADPTLLRNIRGPFVEGAVVAAVSAASGGTLDDVERAVAEAAKALCSAPNASQEDSGKQGCEQATVMTTVGDKAGLHARPAAHLAMLVAPFGCRVRVAGADASSPLAIMGLRSNQGDELEVHVTGPNAARVASTVAEAISAGFDE